MHAGKLITLTLTILLLGPLAACNTFEGLGEDLESLGKNMQSSASGDSSQSVAANSQPDDQKADNARFDRWREPAVQQR